MWSAAYVLQKNVTCTYDFQFTSRRHSLEMPLIRHILEANMLIERRPSRHNCTFTRMLFDAHIRRLYFHWVAKSAAELIIRPEASSENTCDFSPSGDHITPGCSERNQWICLNVPLCVSLGECRLWVASMTRDFFMNSYDDKRNLCELLVTQV